MGHRERCSESYCSARYAGIFAVVFCGIFRDSIVAGFSDAYNSLFEKGNIQRLAAQFLYVQVFSCS